MEMDYYWKDSWSGTEAVEVSNWRELPFAFWKFYSDFN